MRRLIHLLLAILTLAGAMTPAFAVDSIRVPLDARAIDLTRAIDRYSGQGDRLQVSTAPGVDGIVRRIRFYDSTIGSRPVRFFFQFKFDPDI